MKEGSSDTFATPSLYRKGLKDFIVSCPVPNATGEPHTLLFMPACGNLTTCFNASISFNNQAREIQENHKCIKARQRQSFPAFLDVHLYFFTQIWPCLFSLLWPCNILIQLFFPGFQIIIWHHHILNLSLNLLLHCKNFCCFG